MVIGHEITHSFDVGGRRVTMDGRMSKSGLGWWTQEADDGFQEVVECMDKQYSAFEVHDGLFLNGTRVMAESMSDNGGLKAAFWAYRTLIAGDDADAGNAKGRQASAMMPELTNDQLFFVSFGQGWCFKATHEYESFWVETNPHAYPPFRVEGAVANFGKFEEAFQCTWKDRFARRREERCENW